MLDVPIFERRLGFTIKEKSYFQEAITHRSYLNEHRGYKLPHNERLEFLGDAVLELIVTENLFHQYDRPEGEMTAWRAALVNGEMLAKIGKELGIEEFLLMSRGEAKRRFTLADHRAATEGVECRKDKDVIDETPAAYKDIDAVMAAQADLVEVVHTLKQVICVKG